MPQLMLLPLPINKITSILLTNSCDVTYCHRNSPSQSFHSILELVIIIDFIHFLIILFGRSFVHSLHYYRFFHFVIIIIIFIVTRFIASSRSLLSYRIVSYSFIISFDLFRLINLCLIKFPLYLRLSLQSFIIFHSIMATPRRAVIHYKFSNYQFFLHYMAYIVSYYRRFVLFASHHIHRQYFTTLMHPNSQRIHPLIHSPHSFPFMSIPFYPNNLTKYDWSS